MPENTEPKQQSFTRFSPSQRFEHMMLLVSFTGLAITGLPQRYAETEAGIRAIEFMGGIESIRIMHRIFAVALVSGTIYHGGILSYNFFVLRSRLTMMPSLRDVQDVINWSLYNLGMQRDHPRMPRFNFIEKAEYLAVVWGTIIMIMTGFMLWNPVATSNMFPGSFIPAAQTAHSAEALLAVLAILIWHIYHVILRRVNPSIFTGQMSREVMEEEHAEELELIEAGQLPEPPSAEVIARRNRMFIPYAAIMTIILVGLLIRFVTVEITAIETVPRVVSEASTLTVSSEGGRAEAGAALWPDLPCAECHGEDAGGAPGALNVALVGTPLDFEMFVQRIRTGPADMPGYSKTEISDQDLADLYAWLQQ